MNRNSYAAQRDGSAIKGPMQNRVRRLQAFCMWPIFVALAATPTMRADTNVYQAGKFSLTQGNQLTLGSLVLKMQNDGNLVLYQGANVLWQTQTGGQTCNSSNPCLATFQSDGNFVVYNGTNSPSCYNKAAWCSQTGGNPGGTLVISTSSPNLEIWSANPSQSTTLWASSMTFSPGMISAKWSGPATA